MPDQRSNVVELVPTRATGATGATTRKARARTKPPAKPRARKPRKTVVQQLAEDIMAMYKMYVVFHSDFAEAEAVLMTLFTFLSYVWEVAEVVPYILVYAPTSESGKSTLFKVTRALVHNPMPVADPSPAALYRLITAMKPILMIEEADVLAQSNALRSVLNTGIEPGIPIVRAGEMYFTFCPKMFVGIAGARMPITDATASRCIHVPLRRKTEKESATKFIRAKAAAEAAPLKDKLTVWGLANFDKLIGVWPENLPEGMTDRQIDSWSLMICIADLIGGIWPKLARDAAVQLSRAIPKPPDPAVQILRDVARVLADANGNWITSRELAERRNLLENREFEDPLTALQLGRRLAGFGINRDSSPKRDGGRSATPQRGYTFRRAGKYTAQWADAFTRYGVTAT